MTKKRPFFRRLFADLVTARPPEEHRADNEQTIVTHEASTRKPIALVPQGDSERDDYARALLLMDAAMTPKDMQDAFGIPAWALDTARLWRAKNLCQEMGIYPPHGERRNKATEALQQAIDQHYSKSYYQRAAAFDRAHMLVSSRIDCGLGGGSIRTWQDVIHTASAWADYAEENQEPRCSPMPNQGGGAGDGKGEDSSSEDQQGREYRESDQEGDNWKGSDKGKRQDEAMRKPAPNYGEDPDLDRAMQSWKGAQGHGHDADINTPKWKDWLEKMASSNPWQKGTVPSCFAGGANPGKLVNADSPDKLPMKRLRKKHGGRRRSEQEGSVASKLHRLALDGKIFRGSVIRGGAKGRGTILVDLSGSMCWDEKDITECLEALPECTIYGYAGGGGIGRLVLLADRGKAVHPQALSNWKRQAGGGNCVDAPALELLARMPKPRIWLSDGGVTNAGDGQTEGIVALCAGITASGRITRVRHAHEAKAIVAGRA